MILIPHSPCYLLITQNTDNVAPLGIGDHEKLLYSTFTYPNPSNNGQFNIQVFGKTVDKRKLHPNRFQRQNHTRRHR